MSDEERISYLRESEGFKANKAGLPLHEGASKEFEKGYKRTTISFGTNVTPRNFGRGRGGPSDWNCVCGNINRGRIRHMLAGREICGLCRQERQFVDKERLGLEDE